ncbi:hypothetical protein Nepgr_007861 [Nepenthes gracilis]|uniref:Uncharacterized protein n=1 Tax=Nepenthes gracilis TaxID=150966 RepID=A0AAD3S8L1_NEPGR|nr:hypothetical protein Nepgr_007861 [Nepenthes gracilis]
MRATSETEHLWIPNQHLMPQAQAFLHGKEAGDPPTDEESRTELRLYGSRKPNHISVEHPPNHHYSRGNAPAPGITTSAPKETTSFALPHLVIRQGNSAAFTVPHSRDKDMAFKLPKKSKSRKQEKYPIRVHEIPTRVGHDQISNKITENNITDFNLRMLPLMIWAKDLIPSQRGRE